MGTSVKRNFALNLINTITGLLFPVITFPYASRILLADGIGQVQFFQSIINYISLCTALGIPLYAVREIAKIRDDKVLCSKTTVEILFLHSLLTLAGYVAVFLLTATVSKIQADIPLFLLLSVSLFFTAIGAVWFYQAVEEFKYITLRSFVVRTFSLIALFVFVRDKSDLFYYAAIHVVAEVGSNVFNFIRLRKYIDKRCFKWKELNPWKHLRPALKIFILNLIISIYVNLDSVMLGFLKDEAAVGYYAAATRLTKVILGIVSSLGAVLLPRFSNLIENNRIDEFRIMANKAVSVVIALSLPLSVGLLFMASPIIHLFCGDSFEPSILTLRIVAPIILFIGLSGIFGMQILYAQGKENIVILSTLTGAIINFSLNFILIPYYAQYGAAFSTFLAELSVTASMIIAGRKYLSVVFFTKRNMHYIIGTILISILLLLLIHTISSEIIILISGILFSILLYYVYLYFQKDWLVLQIIKIFTSAIKQL
jgi:O-antigen/teichoic acid export membrane protein